ncbi:DUF3219 family protein [Ferdinandcohnia quinoae]|uniref:YkvR family protein n=1 Tax=Fredinandcohnia quinoae TaxID=2918902 RepID=A0AAW5E6U8_9BACI|nr:DUF3219 family protein [Fredinandcohnia sp. SECRCQ15]MCH1625716.1 YkvR family protein [Fredinandcohnia sp. SECRCQ15]
MITEVLLNNKPLKITKYEEERVNGLNKISVEFHVTSEEYHDITTLLYEGKFDIKIPNKSLAFKGKIQEYSTSITNLYEKGQVGLFKLSLIEIKEG